MYNGGIIGRSVSRWYTVCREGYYKLWQKVDVSRVTGGERLMFVYNGVLSGTRLAVWIRLVEKDNYELCEEVYVSRVT